MNIYISVSLDCEPGDVLAIADSLRDRKPSKAETVRAIRDAMPEFKELVTQALADECAGNVTYGI